MSDSKLLKNTGLFLYGQRNIFVVSDKKDGVMTEVCQCNDKWKSMLTFIGEEKYEKLILRLSDCRVENLIDEPLDKDYIAVWSDCKSGQYPRYILDYSCGN